MGEEECKTTTHNGRKFDFYEIEWVIENFCLASCTDSWILETDEFTVRGHHTTKWKILLKCCSEKRRGSMALALKRCSSDEGPDVMWVDWRMNVCSPDSEADSTDRLCCFKRGSECSEDLDSLGTLVEKMKPFEPDLLTVCCKMLFYSEDASKGFEPCIFKGIRSLSEDLLRLFHTSQNHDLGLRFEDRTILTHKVIACSRIEELNYLLEGEGRASEDGTFDENDTLDLSALNYDGMTKVLEYVYSGDLKHVLAEPSLTIYDCVWKLNIEELKSYYTPNKFFFRSTVISQEIFFKWNIPDIRILMCNECEKSPVFLNDFCSQAWQLHLSVCNEGNIDYFGIKVETSEELEPMNICLEFALADKNDRYFFSKRKRYPTEGIKTFGFTKFVSGNVAKSFSEDNTLLIVARLRLSDGQVTSFVKKHVISIQAYPSAEKCFSLLSFDMGCAYESGFFSDIHLENNGIFFKLHKCIMAARSSEIDDLVQQVEQNDDTIPDVPPNIFNMLLKYLYAGIVADRESDDDFVRLYDLAVRFNLTVFKELCSKGLQLVVHGNVGIRAKALEISERNQDEELKAVVRKYISEL